MGESEDAAERPGHVSDLVEGRTLRSLIAEQGPLPVPQAVQLAREIADGLAEAHARGILHCGLEASKVMVTLEGRAKILGFGLPDTGALSPEQVQGLPPDARSDLFSLGSLLYEILTGKAPFRGETPAVTRARILGHQPPPLPEVRIEASWELSLLVEKLLEKNPQRRPESAARVAETLAVLASTLHPPANGAPPPHGGEQRLLTVLCCGMVGFDEASGKVRSLELESVPDAMDVLLGLAREVCGRFSGRLGTVLEDRLWLYFGHPQAREDDVERAVGAARELVARSAEIGPGLAVRVAVHTGPVLFVNRSGHEQLLAGATLDTATEIQNAAPVRAVVVSAASRPFIEHTFATEPLLTVQVPGSAEPIPVYRVLTEAPP